MADYTSRIKLIIEAQNKATTELAKLGVEMNRLKDKTTSAGSSVGKLVGYLGGATMAYFAVKKGILASIEAWKEQQKVTAQTEAVIKSMGGESGMTAKAVGELASSLMNVTTYADEAIQGAMNLLLTFGNIKDDIFPQATEVVIDMSYALGDDLNSSAIRVGKALQDPILGVAALRRVGVNFNQTQTETIKKLVDTGKGLEAQQMILKELSKEFGGSARKALETYGGRVKWLKNQAGELQEAFGKGFTKGLTDAFMQGVTGIDDFNARMAYTESMFTSIGAALVNGFSWVIKSIWNMVQILGRIIATPFALAYASALDNINNIMNLLKGDFSVSFENFKYAWSITTGGIGTDIEDMKNAFINAYVSVDGATNDMADTFNAGGAAVADFGEAVNEAGKKIEETTKKLDDMRKEMKKAVKSAEQDIKDLKKEFAKTEIEKQKELGTNIAQIILNKEEEKKKLLEDYQTATEEDQKKTIKKQIDEIVKFFAKHKGDFKTYAKDIKALRHYNALDEIEKLKYTFKIEQKEREKAYKEEKKALKKHLKEIKEEYKDKLDDIKDELDDLIDKQHEAFGAGVSKSAVKSAVKWVQGAGMGWYEASKQFGGAVSRGQSYIVGEHRPEVFVPLQSGNIKQAGGGEITVNFNNPVVRNDYDLQRILDTVKRTLNRDSFLSRYGVRAI